MRKHVKLYSFFLVLFLFISATKNPVADQQKDFSIFKEVLLEKEGTLNLNNSIDSIHLFLKYVEFKFQKEQTILGQYKLYSAALSMIQCGHTQIHPNNSVLFQWLTVRKSMPFDVYFIGKHLMVNDLLEADSELIQEGKPAHERTKTIKAGAEILTIDDKTIPEIMNEISPFLSSDENGIDFKYFQAGQMFDFYRHISSPFTKDSIHVTYLYKKDTNELYFIPGAAPVRTINLRSKKNAERFELDEANLGEFTVVRGRGYFRFRSFKESYGKKYNEFLKKSFEKIKSKKIDEIIVDLRGNTGGAMQYEIMAYFLDNGTNLGSYVVEKPRKAIESRYIKKMTPDFIKHRKSTKTQKRMQRKNRFDNGATLVENSNEELRYQGRILVITDEGTFSSASMLACHLKTLCGAKIMGRPSGGSFYIGNAGTLKLHLPKSKFTIFVNPNTFRSHLKPSNNPQIIKQPDVLVNSKIIDRKKRDEFYLKTAIRSFNEK
ncbi:MAG: S41 family peptidase [Crocinitomicaceae bacterium]